MKRRKNNGFSLIELIVVIAILAVMVVVLAPKLLSYTERSRANKDDSSMDEVVNAIQLALADQEIYDEVVQFSTADNISCYIDSSSEADYQKMITKSNPNGVDQYTFTSESRTKDETPFYAAGNMRGVTITFAPFKDSNVSKYDLKQGVVNQYVQAKKNQRFGAMPKLYGRVRSVTGDVVSGSSQTYRNSEYTIFIRVGTTGGNDASKQDAVKAYGQWSGTNLPASVSYKIVSDRTTGDDGAAIVIDDNEWNADNGWKMTINPGDLNGGGSFTPDTKTGNKEYNKAADFAADEKDIYAYLINGDTLVLRNSPRSETENITKEYGKLGSSHYRNWTADVSAIKTVNIETPILPKSCYYWFDSCQNLTKIKNLDYMVMDECTTMYAMFHKCSTLTSLDLSSWDTGNVTTMHAMFCYCYKLTSVGDLSGWNTSKVTSMRSMFADCRSITSLDLSDWDTSNVTTMFHMLIACHNLTSVGDLSDWNTSKVTSMYRMFMDCKNLTSLDLSGWDTSKVTDMYRIFYNCPSLTSVDLSGWNTSNVTSMLDMFNGCKNLASINLSGWDTSKVTNMSYMFYGCTNLTELNLTSFTTNGNTNERSMFNGCTKLKKIYVNSTFKTSGAWTEYMFMNCPAQVIRV